MTEREGGNERIVTNIFRQDFHDGNGELLVKEALDAKDAVIAEREKEIHSLKYPDPKSCEAIYPGAMALGWQEKCKKAETLLAEREAEIERLTKLVNHTIDLKSGSDKSWKEKNQIITTKLEVMRRLLTQIKHHGHAHFFYNIDFLPPCKSRSGIEYDHMDKKNPLKCMFAHPSTCGHDWGGLCPGHEELFNRAITQTQAKEKE